MINNCNLSGLGLNEAIKLAMGLSAVQAPDWIWSQAVDQVINGIEKTPGLEKSKEDSIQRVVGNIAGILDESRVRFQKPIQISRDLLNQSLSDTMDQAKILLLAEAPAWKRDQNLAEAMGIARAKAPDRDKGEFEAESIAKAIDKQTREIYNVGELDLLQAVDQAIGLARAKAPVQLQDLAREKAKSIIRAMISDENGGEVIAQIIDEAVQAQTEVLEVETHRTTTPVSMSKKNAIDLAMSLAALQAPALIRDQVLAEAECSECEIHQMVAQALADAQARFQAPIQIPEDLQNADLLGAWLVAVDHRASLWDRDKGLAEAMAIVRAKASNLEGEVKARELAESVDGQLRMVLAIEPNNLLYAVDRAICLARAKAPTLVQDKARAKVIYIARSIFPDQDRGKMIMMARTIDKAMRQAIDKAMRQAIDKAMRQAIDEAMQQDQTGIVKGGN